MEERLNELTSLQRLMSREAWSSYQTQSATDISWISLRPGKSESAYTRYDPSIWKWRTWCVEEPALQPDKSPYATTLAVRGEPIGVLGVEQAAAQMLSSQDEEFLQAISDQVAQALERARLMEQTQRSAVELTGSRRGGYRNSDDFGTPILAPASR